jgi:hypothetical protein
MTKMGIRRRRRRGRQLRLNKIYVDRPLKKNKSYPNKKKIIAQLIHTNQ